MLDVQPAFLRRLDVESVVRRAPTSSSDWARFGLLASVGLGLRDLSAKLVVVGLEFGAAFLELVEQRVGEPSPSDVGADAEVAGEAVAQDGGFVGELADLFAGVGEVGPQALFGDECAGEQPGPVAAGLALAVPGIDDPPGEAWTCSRPRRPITLSSSSRTSSGIPRKLSARALAG